MDHQPFPTTGRLACNMNFELAKLINDIYSEQAEVYCYVVETIKNENGHFIQTGSAPNLQGDMISLCTCKHLMRTSMAPEEWKERWIAGFSGLDAGNRNNALVYLMKVGYAFKSHMSLWFSDLIPEGTKQAKSAQISKFGDIYRPKNRKGDEFAFQSYFQPIENHIHCNNNYWYNDISYEKGFSGRKAALLIGDPEYSFLWNQPMIFYKGLVGRNCRKRDLQTLLSNQLEK
jgi:hypothetical protein